jgi:methionine-rich copper-binding protein CopC
MSEAKLKQAGAALTWIYNGHSYGLFKTAKTWNDASSFAKSIGGYLTKVDDSNENKSIYSKVSTNFSKTDQSKSTAPDGGEAAYVWLGATDSATEGSWKWAKDNATLATTRSEWGAGTAFGSYIKEPDNSYNQDFLALGMTKWPNFEGYGKIGSPGQWNDVQGDNTLYFVVEMDTTTSKDMTAPALTSVTPTDNAKNVAVNANFVLKFSETVKAGTGSFVIKSGSKTVATIAANDNSQVTYSGSTVTINPKSDLANNTSYSVTAASGVIADSFGNKWAGTGSNPYDFTTVDKLKQAGAALTWIYNGHSYGLFKTAKTWNDASSFAKSIGGYLTKVDDNNENKSIYAKVSSSFSKTDQSKSMAPDGGEAAYVWLGASDSASEGSWKWAKDNATLATTRSEWGAGTAFGSYIKEPDNSYNQDFLALGMTKWPNFEGYGKIGSPGQWNDVQGDNTLYFVVEMDAATNEGATTVIPTDVSPPEAPDFLDWFPKENSNLRFEFNEPIKVKNEKFIWLNEVNTNNEKIGPSLGFSFSTNGSVLTVDPISNLKDGHKYSIGFDSSSIADLVGNSWPANNSIHSFIFSV